MIIENILKYFRIVNNSKHVSQSSWHVYIFTVFSPWFYHYNYQNLIYLYFPACIFRACQKMNTGFARCLLIVIVSAKYQFDLPSVQPLSPSGHLSVPGYVRRWNVLWVKYWSIKCPFGQMSVSQMPFDGMSGSPNPECEGNRWSSSHAGLPFQLPVLLACLLLLLFLFAALVFGFNRQ